MAHGDSRAAEARKILDKYIDDAWNGVFLPANKRSPNPKGAIVHATLSNKTLYYQKVEEYLRRATSQADALRRLRRIGETLENGTFYNAIP